MLKRRKKKILRTGHCRCVGIRSLWRPWRHHPCWRHSRVSCFCAKDGHVSRTSAQWWALSADRACLSWWVLSFFGVQIRVRLNLTFQLLCLTDTRRIWGGAGAQEQLSMQMRTRWLFFYTGLLMLWTKFNQELKENLPYLCFRIKGLGGGLSFYFGWNFFSKSFFHCFCLVLETSYSFVWIFLNEHFETNDQIFSEIPE